MLAVGLAFGGVVGALTAHGLGVSATAATQPPLRAAIAFSARHPADVLRIIDGDMFAARVHVWPGLTVTTKVRLRGIDAPEMGRALCHAERVKAQAAREALTAMLAAGRVGIPAVSLDKYGGRVVADTSTRRLPNVSQALLATGLVRPYTGGRRLSWCDGNSG